MDAIPHEVIGLFNLPILQPYCGTRVDQASNRNKFQESFWGIRAAGQRLKLTSPPFESQFYKKCVSLDVSQPHGLHGILEG
jgi:hypothetical protein